MSNKVRPISPDEVKHVVPDFIITAVNKLIMEKWDGEKAKILQDEILAIVASNGEVDDTRPSCHSVLERHWLDFEDIYEDAGWHVDYDAPDYCDDYSPYFLFTKKHDHV
ncbi:MAG: hypothetical protein J6Y37_09765 [Paludibacteraceae bacterium]|nr:hypothetical protein [Paludibacteraceae bacterium]